MKSTVLLLLLIMMLCCKNSSSGYEQEMIRFIDLNSGRLVPFYLEDIDSDNQLEIISTLCGGEISVISATVYDYNNGQKQIEEVGTLYLDAVSDEHKFICYKNPKNEECFLYNIVSATSAYRDNFEVWEYGYNIKNGTITPFCISTNSEIPKMDKMKLKEYMEQRKEKMAEYEVTGEIILDRLIGNIDVWNGSYADIIRNYNKNESNIELSINGTIEIIPWSADSYVIEENFDWEKLQQLPNLRNIVINMTTEPNNVGALLNIKSVKSLKFVRQLWKQEDFNLISNMDSLEELYLDKCKNIDLAFLKDIEHLKFLSISYEDVEKALHYIEKSGSLEKLELHNCTREQYREILEKYPQYTITMVDDLY